MTDEQKQKIKEYNNISIRKKGYRVNEWLPILETTFLRSIEEIKGRMSVMNALINISFEAPTYIIRDWIDNQKLTKYLSTKEKQILAKDNEDLTDREINSLRWYLESLWALMWLTNMIDNLDAEEPVGDHSASLLPNLEQGETNQKLDLIQNIRDEIEVYTMLDYYYRLHWYCVNERLNGRPYKLNEGQIYERRKSLEWAYNRIEDWDNVDMGT
ncbi:DUF4272 domain-containing protein [Riemerella anatipestifer]|nr:DUF4272 domain-containing protein [Riemerella anatipestifer]MDY3326188.1 DUF4272 domain-containing protein [Riemerella anatipestifer]MDY3354538.1 DUF4272 domain-containing protein [Riemerella anatipestifer]